VDNWREHLGERENLSANVLDTSRIGSTLLAMLLNSSVQILNLQSDIHGFVPDNASLFDGWMGKKSEIHSSKLSIKAMDEATAKALVPFLHYSSNL
jgi:hypothetical protein